MKLLVKNTRSIVFVPKSILFFLLASFIAQCIWHTSFATLNSKRDDLFTPPQESMFRLISLDDTITAAKWVMLWLQAFDNQPGISIPLKELNYDKVQEWLDLILALDNKTQYPLLAAIRFYAEVADESRQRKMVNYVSKKFLEDPNGRWAVMTHAVHIAKHRIKDKQLAVSIARTLREHAKGDNVPYWAKQMEIFVLEDMGELESAMVIIGGLLESGELQDQRQIEFLSKRLKEIEERQGENKE